MIGNYKDNLTKSEPRRARCIVGIGQPPCATSASRQSSDMIRVTTYRIHPGTLRRAQGLKQIAGANRFLWNWAIGRNEDAMRVYRESGGEKPSISFFNLGREFTILRNSEGYEWLKELPFGCVRHALKRYADTMQRAVRGTGGFPKRKYAEDRNESFTIPDGVRVRAGALRIPKLGWLPISRRGGDPWAHGKAKQAVVRQSPCGRWYAHVFWEVPDEAVADNGPPVGVDLNVGQVATTEGRIMRGPSLERLEARARRYQRRMSRRRRVPLRDAAGELRRNRKGGVIKVNSGRRERMRVLLAKTRRKIAEARRNWHHHLSADLAGRFGTVVLEDLQIGNMTKSARGTRENPGRNVRAKAGLNRAILATGWGAFGRLLDYKAHRVVRVPPQYTSMTCHRCGHAAAANRRTQPNFQCVSCGYAGNADVNAAFNILALGIGAAGRGLAQCGPAMARPSEAFTAVRARA